MLSSRKDEAAGAGWGRPVRRAAALARCQLYVEGRLESRSFTDKEGKEREVTEVIASDVQFLDGPGTRSADLPPEDRADALDLDGIPF